MQLEAVWASVETKRLVSSVCGLFEIWRLILLLFVTWTCNMMYWLPPDLHPTITDSVEPCPVSVIITFYIFVLLLWFCAAVWLFLMRSNLYANASEAKQHWGIIQKETQSFWYFPSLQCFMKTQPKQTWKIHENI